MIKSHSRLLILYGAFGRHNFGDLLFPHIVQELLIQCNVLHDEVVFCDLLSRDMTVYGGHQVDSITKYFDYEGKVDVIHVGGQTGAVRLKPAIKMIDPRREHDAEVHKIKSSVHDPAYLLDKSMFQNPGQTDNHQVRRSRPPDRSD